MQTLVSHGLVLLGCLIATITGTENAREQTQVVPIPLKEIWAYGMPGTRGVGSLDAAKEPTGVVARPIVNQIVTALASRHPKEGETVGPAFIVRGTGRKALENAKAVLTGTVKPESIFPPETDLTLVFYSTLWGSYVRIVAIEKFDHTITVKYQFVSHSTRDDTLHFALIPVGHLPEGKYELKIEQMESVDVKGRLRGIDPRAERVVCHGTSFNVRMEKP